ncbi:MAG: SDR family oxidoreductase [Gammaproteobacteria bacterium]|nr:SDR family oxidoreductase [Gammaproteobacteria bacterium]
MTNVVVLGATSGIAIELLRIFASEGCSLYIAARNPSRLVELTQDLLIRGASATYSYCVDINNISQLQLMINTIKTTMGHIDIAIIAHGTLPDQLRAEIDMDYMLTELNTNGISTIAIASLLANEMQSQKYGSLCVISSVAGDRGRKSNYIYGAAKSAVSVYMQGLRNRLYPNIHVLTVKPGFVDTPMTRRFKKGILWSTPEKVARDIRRAIDKRKDILYTPWFWKWIMVIIKLLPEYLFKRLSL